MASDWPRTDCRSRTNGLLLSLNQLRTSGVFARWCALAQEKSAISSLRASSWLGPIDWHTFCHPYRSWLTRPVRQ
jgi:hypothetical protein